MKKCLTALLLALTILVCALVTAQAASSYRSQLDSVEREIYDAMTEKLSQGYDSFDHQLSQTMRYTSAEEANTAMQRRFTGIIRRWSGWINTAFPFPPSIIWRGTRFWWWAFPCAPR